MGNQLISMNAICFKLFWYKIFVHSKLKLPNFLVDFVLSLDCHVHKFGIQSKRKTEKKRKSGRPAKLNEKKGDRDLEREMKNKGDIFLLEEEDENFTAAVIK